MVLRLRKRADRSGPEPARNADGKPETPWPLAGVDIEGDPPERHHFPVDMVTKAVGEGWISLNQGRLTIHTLDGDVIYRIDRTPGAYCCHCGQRIGDGPAATSREADRRRTHTDECCDGADHPAEWPGGYEVINYFDCTLES